MHNFVVAGGSCHKAEYNPESLAASFAPRHHTEGAFSVQLCHSRVIQGFRQIDTSLVARLHPVLQLIGFPLSTTIVAQPEVDRAEGA